MLFKLLFRLRSGKARLADDDEDGREDDDDDDEVVAIKWSLRSIVLLFKA
jgi:hypothetical protein